MKIAIDCRHIDSSGIGVYFKGCLPLLLDSANDFLLIGNAALLANVALLANAALPESSKAEIIHCVIKPFSLRDTFAFPRNILKKINACDLFYSPYFNVPGGIKVPVFTTIHDILFADMPELVSLPGLWARMFFYRRSAKRYFPTQHSAAIITVSDFSKSRIEHYLGKKTPVINASNAVKIPSTHEVQGEIIKKKQILFIGNIKKHKGLNVLLDAFLRCREEGLEYQLVIVGSKDNFRTGDRESSARLEGLERLDVTFTGFVSDAEKWRLLSEAALLVQPSLYEGFGYPPLEAMLSGTPALISDIPVFREVYGDFPVRFFKAADSADLKIKIMELLQNKAPKTLALPVHLKEKYCFEKTVSHILAEFEKIPHKVN